MGLAPFRMLCMGVSSTFCGIKNNDGMAFWVDWGMKLASFADKQSLFVQIIMLAVILIISVPVYALEVVFGAAYAPLFIMTGVIGFTWLKRCEGVISFSKKKGESL